MSFSESKKMKDYIQRIQNCGAVAALFAVYGPNKSVEEKDLDILKDTRWTAVKIAKEVNQRGKRYQIKAKFYDPNATVRVPKTKNKTVQLKYLLRDQFRKEVKESTTGLYTVEAQLKKAESILNEYMVQLLEYYNPRCVILSGESIQGHHWQTYYKTGNTLRVYNGRHGWIPELLIGMGPGLIAVTGPKIQRII